MEYTQGNVLIGLAITVVIALLLSGGFYYYLSKQIPEVSEIVEKPAEEEVVELEEEVVPEEIVPPEEEIVPPEEEIPPEEVGAEITCQNECSPAGLKRCSDNGYQICGNYDADTCLEWSSTINCPMDTFCQNGVCIQQTCGGKICPQHQECINNKCLLKYTSYKMGLAYVYNNLDTYNPNWRTEMNLINNKVVNALKSVSDNKIDASINILGEIQTNVFCWNPAEVGGRMRNIELGEEFYFRMPCSMFSETGVGITGFEITESYCNNCVLRNDVYTLNCDNILSYSNLWETNKLNELKQEISQKLGINFEDYDGVFIIFGKLGQVLSNESEKNLIYRCSGLAGVIGGYSNLIMGENYIKSGGLVSCSQVGGTPYYDKIGWGQMVHEILHRFGTVDIYETGPVFGYDTRENRRKALELDPKADESVMGNEDRDCMEEDRYEKDGNICTQEELERVYLDKYNRRLIGLE